MARQSAESSAASYEVWRQTRAHQPAERNRRFSFYFAVWPDLPRLISEGKVAVTATPERHPATGLFFAIHNPDRQCQVQLRGRELIAVLESKEPVGPKELWDGVFFTDAEVEVHKQKAVDGR